MVRIFSILFCLSFIITTIKSQDFNSVVGDTQKKGTTYINSKSYSNITYFDLNNIKELVSTNTSLIALLGNGLRQLNFDGSSRLISVEDGLYNNNVSCIYIYDNQLLIVYDQVIDVFSFSDFKLIKRHFLNENISYAIMDEKSIYYATSNKFTTINRINNNVEDSVVLNSSITSLKYFGQRIVIETEIGFSTYNLSTKNTNHFIENKTLVSSRDEFYSEADYYNYFNWIGKIGNVFIGEIVEDSYESYSISKEIIFFDPLSNALIDSLENTLYSKVKNLIIGAQSCMIERQTLLIIKNNQYTLYNISVAKNTLELITKFKLSESNSKYLPNAVQHTLNYPIGSKINSLEYFQNNIYLATDRGLFSFDNNKHWQSHFISESRMYGSDILATEENIYFYGEGNARFIGSWSRFDRITNVVSHFPTTLWDAYTNTIKVNGNELLAATPNGMFTFDFARNQHKLVKTEFPIGQVGFRKNKFLASNSQYIYEYDKSGILNHTYALPNNLADDNFKPGPRVMHIDGDDLIMVSNRLGGSLTFFNLKSKKQLDYYLSGASDYPKIFSDEIHVWIFSYNSVYRFNKKSQTLFREGHIKNPENLHSLPVYDVLQADSVFYLTTEKGVYELNKQTLEFGVSRASVFNDYHVRNLTKQGDMYFFRTDDGMIQMNKLEFESSFTKENSVYFYKYNFPDGIILPFTEDNITIKSSDLDYLFHFSLVDYIEEYYLNIDRVEPYKDFKIYLDDKELPLTNRGTNQRYPDQNIYQVQLKKSYLTSQCMNLRLFYTKNGKEMLIREWQLEIDQNQK